MKSRNNKISPVTSMVIALVRFPLPMAVMAIHFFRMAPFDIKGVTYDPASFPLTRFFIRFVDIFVGDFSVPVFFFVPGFLFFAGGFSFRSYCNKLKRRARSLLLPYIVWNVLAVVFAWILLLPLFSSIMPSLEGQSFHMTWSEFFNGFIVGVNENTNPHAGNLWFVRELMTVILLAPLINWLIDRLRGWYIAAVAVFWIFCFVSVSAMYLQFISSALLFFSLGALWSKREIDPVACFSRYLKYAVALFLILGCVSVFLGESTLPAVRALKVVTIPCALIIAFSVAAIWGQSNVRRRLFGEMALSDMIPGVAFYLFVAHSIVLWHFKLLVFHLFSPSTDIGFLATFILAYLFMTACLVLFYWLIGKIWPMGQRVISGRF